MECHEAFYGGAAGGGKSEAILMAALQFVDVPGYSAIIFRRTYADLALAGALMERAHEYLGPTAAKWNGTDKRWTFPSGATLTFGYLDTENDKYRYQSSEFQFIGFDELTHFKESQYTYLFSRLRKRTDMEVPLRMRSASNPGGVGHLWVKGRFIGEFDKATGKILVPPVIPGVFVPAKLKDNPTADQDGYKLSLSKLDALTRKQLQDGDWDAVQGDRFKREWFEIVGAAPTRGYRIRYWDKGATQDGGDASSGILICEAAEGGQFYIEDDMTGHWSAMNRNKIIKQTAELDREKYGFNVETWMEQEGGSGGKESAEISIRELAGHVVYAETVSGKGDKGTRAKPMSAQAEAGNIKIVAGAWNRAYLNELCAFTGEPGGVDNRVDASSGAFNKLALRARAMMQKETPQAAKRAASLVASEWR